MICFLQSIISSKVGDTSPRKYIVFLFLPFSSSSSSAAAAAATRDEWWWRGGKIFVLSSRYRNEEPVPH